MKQLTLLFVVGLIYNNLVAQDLVSGGSNSWIFHTPDDGRTKLYVAPKVNGNWDFGKQFTFSTLGEFSAQVGLFDNEIRIANTFMAGDPAIGTFDNSGYGINIHKTSGIGFAFDGVHKYLFTPTGEFSAPVGLFDNEIRIANTFMAGDPAIGTFDNSGYGINIHKTSGIGFAFDGVHKYLFTPTGEFSAPVGLFDNEIRIANTFMAGDPGIGTFDNSGYGINIHKTSGIGFAFNGDHKILFRPSGNVAIHGKLEAKEIKVTTTPTADFVFEDNYELLPLGTVKNFVKTNKHLPEIAPASEMVENGVDIGTFQIQLLQKIEELTIYLIEQDEHNRSQEEQLKNQSVLIEQLRDELSALKKGK